MCPELPVELWRLILSYRGLFFAPYLRISLKDLAIKKIQHAARIASSFRARSPWKDGMCVRVYRPNAKKWLFGRIACFKFDKMTPSENWAVVVMFTEPGPKLLIFIRPNLHPPLRCVTTNITESLVMAGHKSV